MVTMFTLEPSVLSLNHTYLYHGLQWQYHFVWLDINERKRPEEMLQMLINVNCAVLILTHLELQEFRILQ